ncbi:hypothetical protein [Sedimentitalea sp.]|uniref:hypothetical protein n=1 Tax=Sedimentitalea sp. TaxID=2048915 RepID=UPI0032997BAA
MRFILALAIILLAGDGIAETSQSAVTRVYGQFKITFLDEVERAFTVPKCHKLKPPSAEFLNGAKLAGDGCMGCTVSPVYICTPDEFMTEIRRATGFEITRSDGKAFRFRIGRATRFLGRYCRATNQRLVLRRPSNDHGADLLTAQWYDGRCK